MDHGIDRGEHHGKQEMPENIPSLEDIKKSIKENLPLPSVEEIMNSLDKNVISVPVDPSDFDAISRTIEDDCFLAAAWGDLKSLRNLILTFGIGRVMNLRTPSECSILHCASSQGQFNICKFLISEAGVDANMRDIQGNTPLHHAVLGRKAKISKTHEKYGSPFFIGRPEDFIREENVGDQIRTINDLVHLGVDINAFNFAEQSALHFAASSGNVDAIENLIRLGCKTLNDPTTDYGTPLRSAASVDKDNALDCLLAHKANLKIVPDGCLSPLLSALTNNCMRCAKKLIEVGADVNYSAHRKTPLEVVILRGDMDIFKSLLDKGAKTNCQDIYGLMPIELAALEDDSDMVGILLDRTPRIEGIEDWSVAGVMKHCRSEEFETKVNLRADEALLYYLSEGDKAYKAKKYMSAMTWYSLAKAIDRDHASFFARKSLCYAGMKHSERALKDAFHCSKLNPNSHLVCYAKGVAWHLHKQFNLAAESFEKAYKLAPDEEKRGEYQDALRHALENYLNSEGLTL